MKEEIQRTPGASPTELARKMGYDMTTVYYHARILAQEGSVRLVRDGHSVRCFPPRRRSRTKLQAILTAKNPAIRRVVKTIQRNPGIHAAEVASRHGLAPATVSYHVGNLRKRGIVRRTPDYRLYMNPRVERWLE